MTSKTRYSHRVRCNRRKCQARDRIKRPLEDYVRRPKCKACGGNLHSIDAIRWREIAKQDTCYCSGYPFPHRKGSLRFCDHHPDFGNEPSAEDWLQYQSCLETPRSG